MELFVISYSTKELKNIKTYLKGTADCAVDEEVDGRVDDHEHPRDEVHLVEVDRRNVLPAGLDAGDDQLGVQDLVGGGHDPGQVQHDERRHDRDGRVRRADLFVVTTVAIFG